MYVHTVTVAFKDVKYFPWNVNVLERDYFFFLFGGDVVDKIPSPSHSHNFTAHVMVEMAG